MFGSALVDPTCNGGWVSSCQEEKATKLLTNKVSPYKHKLRSTSMMGFLFPRSTWYNGRDFQCAKSYRNQQRFFGSSIKRFDIELCRHW